MSKQKEAQQQPPVSVVESDNGLEDFILRVLMKRLPEMLATPCPQCKGDGVIKSKLWLAWWDAHEHDWREAIKDENNVPKEGETIRCESCKGGKLVLTRLGLELVKAVHLANLLSSREE